MVISILLVAGISAALGHSKAWSGEPKKVAAMVNGEPVTVVELQRMLADPVTRQQLQQELGVNESGSKESDFLTRLALRKLTSRRLILQEARRQRIIVPEQEIDQAVLALRRRFTDIESFGIWFKERGLDERSLFDFMRDEMLISRVSAALVEGVRVSDEQVQEYYNAHREDLKKAGDVRLRIIAVRDKEAAEKIFAALQQGKSFDRLARERSKGRRAAHGGDTGWVDPGTLQPPLKEAVAALKPGEASRPLQRGEEFLIVGMMGRRSPRTKSLAEARQEIERRLLPAERQKAFQTWLAEQERNATIEVFP
jgi:parvulin-like peptidyl-prolyl isomerase